MFIDSNRIKETLQNVTIRQGEGEKGRATELRRNELIRVWMVIELYRLEGHHFVSLSFKEEMRECNKAKGVYTVLEARRQCENEIRRRG